MRTITQRDVESWKKLGKLIRKSDPSVSGFRIIVGKTGRVSYSFMYKVGGKDGKRRTVSLGTDEFLTLKEARAMALKFRSLVLQGIDPQVVEQTKKKANHAPRLDDVMAKWIETNKNESRYWHERINQIEWIIATMGKATTVKEISRQDIIALLDKKVERDSSGSVVKIMHGAQKNIHSTMRGFFNWCIGQEYIEFSPMTALPSPKTKKRRRILTDKEIILFWDATEEMSLIWLTFFRVLLLTGQRRELVSGMKWEELDLDRGIWQVSGLRTKNGLPHIIHLSDLVVRLISKHLNNESDFVFTTTGTTHISGYSKAKMRIDKIMTRLNNKKQIETWGLHTLRKTCATGMQRQGTVIEVCRKVLHHTDKGLDAEYMLHDRIEERRNALIRWSAALCLMIEEEEQKQGVV